MATRPVPIDIYATQHDGARWRVTLTDASTGLALSLASCTAATYVARSDDAAAPVLTRTLGFGLTLPVDLATGVITLDLSPGGLAAGSYSHGLWATFGGREQRLLYGSLHVAAAAHQ